MITQNPGDLVRGMKFEPEDGASPGGCRGCPFMFKHSPPGPSVPYGGPSTTAVSPGSGVGLSDVVTGRRSFPWWIKNRRSLPMGIAPSAAVVVTRDPDR